MRTAIRWLTCSLAVILMAGCQSLPFGNRAETPLPVMTLNEIGEASLRLVLAMGVHDPDYVDAYYGPAALREDVTRAAWSLPKIERQAQALLAAVDGADSPQANVRADYVAQRRVWLTRQLAALIARAQMLQGRTFTFDEESQALYNTVAPRYQESDFAPALARIEKRLPRLPGDDSRTLAERYNRYLDRHAVPADKLDAVMQLAIEAARTITYNRLPMPIGEGVDVAYVSGKPWSAYNWYRGNLASRIEINTELPIPVLRVLELAVHEGYPGHHAYNALLENGLVNGYGWHEFQAYALFSPQSLIAEGTADYGIGLAFPGGRRLALVQQLFKAAGLPVKEAGRYLDIVDTAATLKPAGIEAARRYLDGVADRETTLAFLERFLLYSPERAAQRLRFIEKYRAYIINYSWGEELVRAHIERTANTRAGSAEQWQSFFQLISSPRTPTMLLPRPADAPPAPVDAALPSAEAVAEPAPAAQTAADREATPASNSGAAADVHDLAAFDAFIAGRPTVAEFQRRYPTVFVVLPGTIATREFRSDRSRYFPELDAEGRIIGGHFS